MLKFLHLEDHTKNIGIDQPSRNRRSFENKCLNNIKYIYQHAGKCDDQQKFKDILDADMVSTPEEVTYVSPSLHITQTTVKNQVLGNHCVYSPKYFMLKREHISFVLNLQNQNTEQLQLELACVPIKKKKREFKNKR